jgi:proton-coupled amino acid transporter
MEHAERPSVAHHTYIAGEDADRLQTTAARMGLRRARNPMGNVRAAVSSMLQDSTLEAARMHSVGALGEDEVVDQQGTLHLRTLTSRKRRLSTGGEIPQYGTLESLFHQGPLVEDDEDVVIEEEMIDSVEGGSLTAAIFGLIKGTVGPAILYLPRGFSMAGFAVAIVSMILATMSYLYSAIRLLQCWKVEKAKVEKLEEIRAFLVPTNTSSEYGAIPKNVTGPIDPHAPPPNLLTYPELARRAFGSAAVFVQFGIAAMQFGVCLTYFIFVPQNLVESVRALFGVEIDKVVFLILMIAIEVPLSWIRDIRKLTPTNILATFLIAYGLLSCLCIAFVATLQDPNSNLLQRIQELPPSNDTWFLFVGTSVRNLLVVRDG